MFPFWSLRLQSSRESRGFGRHKPHLLRETPLTLAHFGEFFKLLPARGDSSDSWTVNFAARLQQALEEARPHREKAAEFFTQAKALEVSVNSPTRKQNWTQDVFRFAASRVRALF